MLAHVGRSKASAGATVLADVVIHNPVKAVIVAFDCLLLSTLEHLIE